MPVVGNHDKEKCYDDRGEIRFRQYFAHLPRTFYHFRHRGLNFVVLNSERFPLPGTEQAKFLRVGIVAASGADDRLPASSDLHEQQSRLGEHVFVPPVDAWCDQELGRDVGACRAQSLLRAQQAAGRHHVRRQRRRRRICTPPKSRARRPARLRPGRNHYGLVDVYADHLAVRVLDLDDQVIDEFAVALARPSMRRDGREPDGHRAAADRYAAGLSRRAFGLTARAPAILPRPW